MNWLETFFQTSEFSPHGFCLAWDPAVFWSHVGADAVIALSYFSIPAVLATFAIKRKAERGSGVLLLFVLFIVSCGVTHLFGIWTLWSPDYGVQAVAKMITAAISGFTAVALWFLLPHALAIPSSAELQDEIRLKTAAQSDLQKLNAELEARVKERTEELERLNEALGLARDEAQHASNAKSAFLASMSHEMRTPLNAIIGFAQFLMHIDAENLSDVQRRYLADINNSGLNLTHLISDLLDLATIEKGKLNISIDTVDASVIVGDLRSELAPLFQEKGVDFSITNTIPDGYKINTDKRRVHQVIRNFVTNAIKYNNPGGAVFIYSDLDETGNVVISVRDEGIGLTDEETQRIFIPFERLGTAAHVAEGTGIGLSISKSIADLIGGQISVKSQKGIGSTFSFLLPA